MFLLKVRGAQDDATQEKEQTQTATYTNLSILIEEFQSFQSLMYQVSLASGSKCQFSHISHLSLVSAYTTSMIKMSRI